MGKITLIFFAATVWCVCAEEYYYPDHEFKRTPLGDAVDRASMKMLKETFAEANDKNVVASPLGVYLLLSMYSLGAGDAGRQEIARALGTEDYEQLYKSYSELSEKFAMMDASYLTLANKVYVDDDYELAENFTEGAVRAYRSEAERVDFGQPEAAVAAINHWADEKTKGHLKEAVDPSDVDASVVAALVNVIFFQGHWNVPFNASETEEKEFRVDRSTVVKKPTMRLMKNLFYHESPELGAKMVELPYKEKGFRMVVVLPDEVDGLPSVLEKVAARGLLGDVFALEPSMHVIDLEMPKFEIKSFLDLNNLLPKVGITSVFTDAAPGIVRGQSVKVSRAFQKAFVKVDEEGATAGAFTGLMIALKSSMDSLSPPLSFKVDHPFLFVILHEETVVFAGTYAK